MKSFSSLVSLIWDQVGSRGKFLYSLSLSTTTTRILWGWVYVSNRFKMSVVLCCYIFVKTSTNFKSFRRFCVHILSSKKKDTKMFFSSFLFSETQQEERLPLRRCEIGSIKLRTIKRSEEVRDISIWSYWPKLKLLPIGNGRYY